MASNFFGQGGMGLNGINGLNLPGLGHVDIVDRLQDLGRIRHNPGRLRGRCYVPADLPPGRASGRRAARLHPDRRGL